MTIATFRLHYTTIFFCCNFIRCEDFVLKFDMWHSSLCVTVTYAYKCMYMLGPINIDGSEVYVTHLLRIRIGDIAHSQSTSSRVIPLRLSLSL